MNIVETKEKTRVRLPLRRIHKTPRVLTADAYTIGSDLFQSTEARRFSEYYITFRRSLHKIDPDLYKKGDDRMIFVGLSRIIEKLFYDPVTHEELDEAVRFLKTAKVSANGLVSYNFPEAMWRRVVDSYNGRPPIQIRAMPEGSVVYPNEPVVCIKNTAPEDEMMGELAAWFESKLLQVWASSERVTQERHWLDECLAMVDKIEPGLLADKRNFYASLMLHDFGDRAGMSDTESEEQGMYHLLVFPGTDTFSGAYQAWKNSGEAPGIAVSVLALAHRNVQAFVEEKDCYWNMYQTAENGSILSMVMDCYSFYDAVNNYALPIALDAKEKTNEKVIVVRPDSGDAEEQVLWVCKLAKRFGLYTERVINGKTWYFATNLKFIEGDGMTFNTMRKINETLMEHGFVPYSWGLYGVGGGLRNNLKRDNFSAKYALCNVGHDRRPVCKFSEDLGKTTLPGPFKVLRDASSLASRKTVVFAHEPGIDALVEYFDGSRIYDPFGAIMFEENFMTTKARIAEQFPKMPLTLSTEDNHNYPASDQIKAVRLELLKKYAPRKRAENYS